MKRICESWINESISGVKNKTKAENKSNKKLKRNNFKNKVKFECLICSTKKNNHFSNNFKNYSESDYDNFYEDEISHDDYYNQNNLNNRNNGFLFDVCKRNNLHFFDKSNYYNYNNDDINDLLRLPNLNDSFTNFDYENNQTYSDKNNRNEKFNKYSKILVNDEKDGSLINFQSDNSRNENHFNREININKENVKVKTLYSNEDISIRYNCILKKLI